VGGAVFEDFENNDLAQICGTPRDVITYWNGRNYVIKELKCLYNSPKNIGMIKPEMTE
jgi:hypothetical protein